MSVTYQKLSSRLQQVIQKDQDLNNLDPEQISKLLRVAFYLIGEALSNGEDIYLEGFGRFRPDCKPPRKIKSGITETVHMTDYKVFVKFTAFKQLNNQVQKFMDKIGFTPNIQEDEMKPIMLPHMREKEPAPEPFETVDKEIAHRFTTTHPNPDHPYQDAPNLPRKVTVPDEKK